MHPLLPCPPVSRLTQKLCFLQKPNAEMPHFKSLCKDATPGSGPVQTSVSQLFKNQTTEKIIRTGAKKEKFDRAGMMLCIHQNVPFSLTSSPSYKNLMLTVSEGKYDGSSYVTNMKILRDLSAEGKDSAATFMTSIMHEVSSSADTGSTDNGPMFNIDRPLSLDLDIWSEPVTGTGLLAINAHTICNQWKKQTKLLGLVNVAKESHTGEFLDKKVKEVLQSYGAPVDDYNGECRIVMAKVADNASNNKKAFGHDTLLSCFCHTLELSIKKFTAVDRVRLLISKVKCVVQHFHMSPKATAALKTVGDSNDVKVRKMVQDVSTRFSSTLDSLVSVLDVQLPLVAYDLIVLKLPKGQGETDFYMQNMLKKDDWTMIQEIIASLQLPANVSKTMEGDLYVTSSMVLPSIYLIIESFQTTTVKVRVPSAADTKGYIIQEVSVNDFSASIREARAAFLEDVKQRWIEDLPEAARTIYLIASKLDPRSKKCQWLSAFPASWKVDLDDSVISELKSRMVSQVDGRGSGDDETMHDADHEENVAEGTLSLSFDIMSQVNDLTRREKTQSLAGGTVKLLESIEEEFQRYDLVAQIPSNQDPLVWWKQNEASFPRVASMAREYLAVPASSASVERVFSSVGLVKADNRPLKDDTTIDIMWAKNVPE